MSSRNQAMMAEIYERNHRRPLPRGSRPLRLVSVGIPSLLAFWALFLLILTGPVMAAPEEKSGMPATATVTGASKSTQDAAPVGKQRRLPAAGNISVQDAAGLLNKAPAGLIILDVRTPQEFREGHLAGARNVDFFGGRFEMETADLPRDATLLIYCRSGKRSAAAAETLGEAGMDRILHMYQGIEGWKDAGLPLVK